MSEFRFPNESDEYRAARNELLETEKELRELGETAARKRRELPLGGRLKENYRFEQADASGVSEVAFEELFGDYETLLLYTMMFGPDWDAACPSCTTLVDGYNATYFPVSQHCAFAVVTAALPEQVRDWARFRGWTSIPVYSAARSSYILDYFAQDGADDPALAPMMNVFRRTPDGIFHTWGAELVGHPMENGSPRHVDSVWPYWNLLDMTPDGRGDAPVPPQDYQHVYFTEQVLGEST